MKSPSLFGLLAVLVAFSDNTAIGLTVRTVSVASYDSTFDALRSLEPRPGAVAAVRHVTLRRDAIILSLDDGWLALATPVRSRTVAAVFQGTGHVQFAPPLAIERVEMQRVLGDSVLDAAFTAAALVFTDSTLAELQRDGVVFTAGAAVPDDALREAVDWMTDGHTHQVDQPTLMSGLLNGTENGFFYAQVNRDHGEDVALVVDPVQAEPIALLRHGRQEGQRIEIVSQFRTADELGDTTISADGRHEPLRVTGYHINATITKGMGFGADVTVGLEARRGGVQWIRLQLFHELTVDSVRNTDGTPLEFYRAKQSPEFWVRLPAPMRAGSERSLKILYHGPLIAYGSVMEAFLPAFGDRRRAALPPALDRWFVVRESQTWFPRYGSFQPTPVDLTFHTPARYQFATIGRLTASFLEEDIETTHWVSQRPTDQVCFNIGEFRELHITDPRIPPVTVQVNSEGHRLLTQLLPGSLDLPENVGADVANSLAFFTRAFGPPLFDHYIATEIPASYGQAFPGLMYLSLWTFQSFDEGGKDEMFRSHEMAHQWWGIGVEPASSRDAWLSEGFAEFSGLWYMQTILQDNKKFSKQLQDWSGQLRHRGADAPPLGLGRRIAQSAHPDDYTLIVYRKGAWVLQMLRNMMLDFQTMKEDAFMDMMRDFYASYRGKQATTRDFQRVVERHTGLSMQWFFDEWVNRSAIPTYVFASRTEPQADGTMLLHSVVRVVARGPVTEATVTVPSEPTSYEVNPWQSVLADVKTEGWK
jgi:hypothetical protein